jgi:ABC-type sugar transport system ATPase subunit
VGRARLIDWRRTYALAQRLLARIGANFPADARVRDLGSGQRQLVEIAKALNMDARVLILDEPTAALSQKEAERLFQLVRELVEAGVGVVYVSHRLEEIAGLVDRVTVLRDGRSVGTYLAGEIDRRKIVALITGHDQLAPVRTARPGQAPGPNVLELRGLSRNGEFENLSFAVRAGEIVVVTGLLGAGRTEMLETIFGARAPDRGEIALHGRPAAFHSPRQAIASGLTLVPEDRRGQGICEVMPLFMNTTLASLRSFVGATGLQVGKEISHTEKLMQEIKIKAPGPRTLARFLSGGNQQKVVLAKWLSTSADVWLFDEPTQGLDVEAKDEIYALMNRFAHEGKAVLVVSSDIEEVLEIADRVIVMRQGRAVGEFAGDRITATALVEAITHGDVT